MRNFCQKNCRADCKTYGLAIHSTATPDDTKCYLLAPFGMIKCHCHDSFFISGKCLKNQSFSILSVYCVKRLCHASLPFFKEFFLGNIPTAFMVFPFPAIVKQSILFCLKCFYTVFNKYCFFLNPLNIPFGNVIITGFYRLIRNGIFFVLFSIIAFSVLPPFFQKCVCGCLIGF